MRTRFRTFSMQVEQAGTRLSQPPKGSLSYDRVMLCATKLRTALNVTSINRSPRWDVFRDDWNQLHSILVTKAA